jgi:pimeloyl-ACP methyl ester carboxylesterase
MLSILALVQKISLEHSSPPVFLAGIGLGRHVVCALLSKFPKLVQGVLVSGMSAGPLDDGDEIIEVHTKEPPKISKVLEDSDATGTDEAAFIEPDSFKLTFNPSYLPERRQLQPTLVLIGQKDTGPLHTLPAMQAHAPAKSGFHLLAYNINTGTNKTQSMTLENAWHYHSIDYPKPFEEIADWVWKCAKG